MYYQSELRSSPVDGGKSKFPNDSYSKSQPTMDSMSKVDYKKNNVADQRILENENESQDTNQVQKISQSERSQHTGEDLSYSLSKQTSNMKEAANSKKAIKDILSLRQGEAAEQLRRRSQGKSNNRRTF